MTPIYLVVGFAACALVIVTAGAAAALARMVYRQCEPVQICVEIETAKEITMPKESTSARVASIAARGMNDPKSLTLAEIIASQWGNCRVGARVVHVDRNEKFVEAEGVFHDLETNTATTSRVRRRLSTKAGKLFDDDMIVVTGNAACSIAKRNAILGAVPKAVWRKAYESVERVIAGDVKTLAERREVMLKAFAAFGIKPEQIFTALGVAGLGDVNLDHIVTLTGMYSALKNGEETPETIFAKDEKITAPAAPPPPESKPAHDAETGEITEVGVPEAFETGRLRWQDGFPRKPIDGLTEAEAEAFLAGWDAAEAENKTAGKK